VGRLNGEKLLICRHNVLQNKTSSQVVAQFKRAEKDVRNTTASANQYTADNIWRTLVAIR
jgi:hypothetical protein